METVEFITRSVLWQNFQETRNVSFVSALHIAKSYNPQARPHNFSGVRETNANYA